MILDLVIILGFLLTFGIFLVSIAVALSASQGANRAEMRRLSAEFERIVERLGEEEGETR